VRGRFVPAEEGSDRGTLEVAAEDSGTAQSLSIPAAIAPRANEKAAAAVEAGEPRFWSVYPRTEREGLDGEETIRGLFLEVSGVRSSELPKSNVFSVRGEVVFCDTETSAVLVVIRRNRHTNRKKARHLKPFKLLLEGTLPEPAIAHFWDLQVELRGTTLAIVRAERIGPVPKKAKPAIAEKSKQAG